MQPTWDQIADLLHQVHDVLQADWKVRAPSFDTLPSELLDVAVDAWCLELSKDPSESLQAPPEVQPWILARLASMSAQAKINAKTGQIPAPQLTPQTMQQFLIGEWHGALKDRWPLLMRLDEKSST